MTTRKQTPETVAANIRANFDRLSRHLREAREAADLVKAGARFAGAPSPRTRFDFEAMAAKAGRKDLLPWPPVMTRQLARALWEMVEPFVNGPEPAPEPAFDYATAWRELRRMVDGIIAGEPPLHPRGRSRAPALWLNCLKTWLPRRVECVFETLP